MGSFGLLSETKLECSPGEQMPQLTKEEEELYWLARTAKGEAEGEGIVGQLLVMFVILNRWKDNLRSNNRFDTIQKVCLAPYQFSCWNSESARRMTGLGNEWDYWMALAETAKLRHAQGRDNANGAMFFAVKGKEADFMHELEIAVEWRNHVFFKSTKRNKPSGGSSQETD